jgi:hypothetical protein
MLNIVFSILCRPAPTFKQITPTNRTNKRQLLLREQCMELERKRAQQQQQQPVSQLQQHLQMSRSATAMVGSSRGEAPRGDGLAHRIESAPAVNIPGVGARIKEIPSRVLQVKDFSLFLFLSLPFLCNLCIFFI